MVEGREAGMEKLTTKKMTKQTTELAGWRAGWLANPVVVTDKLRHRAWKDEKSRSCIGDEFLGCKSGVQKAGNSQKGMAYSIQRNPPPKKSPKHRTNNNSNKSNEVLLIARRLQQHTRRYSRPKILLHALHSQNGFSSWVVVDLAGTQSRPGFHGLRSYVLVPISWKNLAAAAAAATTTTTKTAREEWFVVGLVIRPRFSSQPH
jgi:hypothetical protein